MVNMTSHIRHQVCKNSNVPYNSISKTRRMVKNETKLNLKCFLYIDYYKIRLKRQIIFFVDSTRRNIVKSVKWLFVAVGGQ